MDIAWIIGEICNYRSFSNKQVKKKFTHNDSRRVSAKTPSGIDVRLLWIIILNEKQTKQTKNKINKTAKKQCGLPAKLIKDGVLFLRLTKLGKNKSEIPGPLYGVRRSRELLTLKVLKISDKAMWRKETYNAPKWRRPAKVRRFIWVMLLKFKPLKIEE